MDYDINKRIIELIHKLDISANHFAGRLGVRATIIYHIQKNRNKPSYDFLVKIITTFGVNPTWLMTGNGEIFLCEKPVDNTNVANESIEQYNTPQSECKNCQQLKKLLDAQEMLIKSLKETNTLLKEKINHPEDLTKNF